MVGQVEQRLKVVKTPTMVQMHQGWGVGTGEVDGSAVRDLNVMLWSLDFTIWNH